MESWWLRDTAYVFFYIIVPIHMEMDSAHKKYARH
jgi:hypothetical protein